MLIGQYTSKLTDNNRLAIPKKFREGLGEKIVVAKWYEGCLVLVSKSDWQELMTRLVGRKEWMTTPVRDIDRFILGSAYEVTTDAQGRFVLPEILLIYSKIKQDLVFIGLDDRVEIWPQEGWQKLENDAEEKASKALEKLAKENDNYKKRTSNKIQK